MIFFGITIFLIWWGIGQALVMMWWRDSLDVNIGDLVKIQIAGMVLGPLAVLLFVSKFPGWDRVILPRHDRSRK